MAALATPAGLWEPRAVYALQDRLVQDGTMPFGHLLITQLRLAWLARHAPINAGTCAMLEQLSDEHHYRIGSRAAVQLAWGWARFGDLPRARPNRAGTITCYSCLASSAAGACTVASNLRGARLRMCASDCSV